MIHISPTTKNSTPEVVRALAKIRSAGGGELHFEKGEYHFFKEGTEKAFFAISNNSACDKHIMFPILDMRDIVIDGHGSLFVFHDVVFPFMVSGSCGISIRNITVDTGRSPLVEFKIHGISEDGFYMDIDRDVSPFFIENGSLCFERESENVLGTEWLFSLHALGRHHVQFFATGDCKADMSNLPASLIKCDVSETPNGIYARYRADSPTRCRYGEEIVTSIIDGGRNVDVICLDRSEEIFLCNITVARGIGMGIVGQLSKNIQIDGFSTDIHHHPGSHQTLTADALHFINCDGKLEIKNCTISDTMDDALNVHGMYTLLTNIQKNVIRSHIGHQEQQHFNPYRAGDRLEIIDNTTFEVVAEFITDSAHFEEASGSELVINGHFVYGESCCKEGFWIENSDRMPNLHLHHNRFYKFPHNRISGGGEILVEQNRFSDCNAALLCLDLARYWYESGRVKHLIYRNNILENCDTAIRIGVDGVSDAEAPKIHRRIEIVGNHFSESRGYAIHVAGVQDLVLNGNVFDSDKKDLFKIV